MVSVTHEPHHAHPVGDRSLLLGRGRNLGDVGKGEVSVQEPTRLVSGSAESAQPTSGLGRPQA